MPKKINKFYKNIKRFFFRYTPGAYRLANKNKMLVKFGLSGAAAASVHFSLLYILTDIVGVWYILSTSVSFIVAFLVSFFLQKFWTFRDNTRNRIKKQMGVYFIVGVVNLLANTSGMYLLVDLVGIMYIIAQFIVGLVIASGTFFVYRYIIFGRKRKWL